MTKVEVFESVNTDKTNFWPVILYLITFYNEERFAKIIDDYKIIKNKMSLCAAGVILERAKRVKPKNEKEYKEQIRVWQSLRDSGLTDNDFEKYQLEKKAQNVERAREKYLKWRSGSGS